MKLTTKDWESSLMDRISNNVTQDFGHELETLSKNSHSVNEMSDQIHEVLAMIKESHYEYEIIIERRNNQISDMSSNIEAMADRLDELENVQG